MVAAVPRRRRLAFQRRFYPVKDLRQRTLGCKRDLMVAPRDKARA